MFGSPGIKYPAHRTIRSTASRNWEIYKDHIEWIIKNVIVMWFYWFFCLSESADHWIFIVLLFGSCYLVAISISCYLIQLIHYIDECECKCKYVNWNTQKLCFFRLPSNLKPENAIFWNEPMLNEIEMVIFIRLWHLLLMKGPPLTGWHIDIWASLFQSFE